MGTYINATSKRPLAPKGKVQAIIEDHGAVVVSELEAVMMNPRRVGIVCVVDNGSWEAAGVCDTPEEIERFADPLDPRPRTWLLLDRNALLGLSS